MHWNRGRLGCETCSSSFTRFELTEGHPAGPNSVLFTGEIPRNASDTRLDVQLTVSLDGGNLAFDDTHARWAPGVLTMSGASQDVVFRSVEFLPPFDPDRG